MRILYIESCNYVDFPVGGQLTFATQMLQAFGEQLDLVGISTDNEKSGRWIKRRIGNNCYNYFNLRSIKRISGRPLIPRRLSTFVYLKRYKEKILRSNYDIVFCNSPEVLLAIRKWNINNITYYFAGTGNPLALSRRWYGRALADFYYSAFLPSLKYVKFILAAADTTSIEKIIFLSRGILKEGNIIQFPSRIDDTIFNADRSSMMDLSIKPGSLNIVTTGRLHWAKGWKLLLDAFMLFRIDYPESHMYFIGDGDARGQIEEFVEINSLKEVVHLPGFKNHLEIASYLKQADIYVMGSFAEGWATSLVEAKACGVPVCTTEFSSARDIIRQGMDGFVADTREPAEFSKLMAKAKNLKIDYKALGEEMKKYSVSTIHEDLSKIWNDKAGIKSVA